jgi:hypothetical protein
VISRAYRLLFVVAGGVTMKSRSIILVTCSASIVLGCSGRPASVAREGAGASARAPLAGPDDVYRELLASRAAPPTATLEEHPVVDARDLDVPARHFRVARPVTAAPDAENAAALPASADLRAGARIKDQGAEGSCTAYAVAGAMQLFAHRAGLEDDMSAAHLWHLQDRVPNIDAAIEAAEAYFVASTSAWPEGAFSIAAVTDPDAAGFARVGRVTTIGEGLDAIESALARGNPVLVASTLNDAWRSPAARVIDPAAASTGTWIHAAHAYGLVGYVQDARFEDGGYFIVRNSWGDDWGDAGFGYMPFSYCRHQDEREGGYCIVYALEDVVIRGQ